MNETTELFVHEYWGTSSQSLTFEQVDDELVGAHHDGRIGDLSDQMCGKSSVKSSIAFLSKHQAETLEERAVLVTFFP